MKRRHLILLLGGASSGAMSIGTGAFSSVEAERGVEVNVVEDDEAYLGLEEGVSDQRLIRVTNQFTASLTLTLAAAVQDSPNPVTVEYERGGNERVAIGIKTADSDDDGSDRVTVDIGPGEDLGITVSCEEAGTYRLEVSFHGDVESTGTTVDKTRSFKKTTIGAVQFPGGSGNAAIESSVNGTVGCTAYYRDGSSIERIGLENQQVGKKFGPNKTDGIEGPVVAVEVDEVTGTFWRDDAGKGGRVDLETAAERVGPPSE